MQLYEALWAPRDTTATEKSSNLVDQESVSKSILDRVLMTRVGSLESKEVQQVLAPDIWHDPFLLPDMRAACNLIRDHVERKSFILIHGDYDVDGITATSILLEFFRTLGCPVGWYIPDRLDEGYGLSEKGVGYAKAAGVSLVITVDCGVSSVTEIAELENSGIPVIVTDHHNCPPVLPDCAAVINPMREDSEYPFRHLAGVGVVLKLVAALCEVLSFGDTWQQYLDLTALGTVADVMPLQDENRFIVTAGLELMQRTQRPGLLALMDALKVDRTSSITTYHIGFRLGPVINAAGRMGDSLSGIECLTAKQADLARQKAATLIEINQRRREKEIEALQDALQKLSRQPELLEDPILVVLGEGWNAGVLGLVAMRLSKRFLRPCIVLNKDSNEECSGSGRSFGDFNLISAIESERDHLLRFGGHSQAVGVALSPQYVDAFRCSLNDKIKEDSPAGIFPARPFLQWDGMARPEELTIEAIEELDLLAPFGKGNPEPQFYLPSCRVLSSRTMGQNRSHLRLEIGSEKSTLNCVCFGRGYEITHLAPGTVVSLLGVPAINVWRNNKSPQLVTKDFKILQPSNEDEVNRESIQHHEARSPLPTKEALAHVYLWLREHLSDGPNMIDPSYCLRFINEKMHNPIDVIMLRNIIDIYHEAGLLDISNLNETNCCIICVNVKSVKNKVDLYKTPTYIDLLERTKQVEGS